MYIENTSSVKKCISYILPAIITGFFFLVILALNGLWPFGKETIDYYDMAQQAEAYYYQNFDQLHGIKSFVFDWFTNLGRGIPGLSEPSIYDLFLYVVPRDFILEAMSLMMMFKIMAAAFFMGLYIRYVNEDIPFLYHLMIASGYGLCGFVLANYTIPQWVDMATFVPLVLMFSQKSLKTGKIMGLSLSVFAIALIDIYFVIQMIEIIFLIGGAFCIYDHLRCKKMKRKSELFVLRFLIGILSGVALAAYSFIPDVVHSLSSARFENGSENTGILGTYIEIIRTTQPAYLSRWFALLSLAFLVSLVILGGISLLKKKRYDTLIFYISCIFMLVAQLFLESIHLILHFGSYVNYPVRNSFMIYCVISGIAAVSCKEFCDTGKDDSKPSFAYIFGGTIISLLIVYGFAKYYHSRNDFTDHDVLLFTMGIMALFAILHVILVHINGSVTVSASIALWTMEILIFGVIMIGKPTYISEYGNDPEQEGEYIRIVDQLVRKLDDNLKIGEGSQTFRIKNPDTTLNANYGMVLKRETLSGWTGLASADQIAGATGLGYSSQFTRLLDSGGNIFSDTLLHIRDVVGIEKPDEKLYEYIASTTVVTDHITGKTDEYYLSRNRYELPFAIPVKYPDALKDINGDVVANVNSYAKAIGWNEPVASYVTSQIEEKKENGHNIISSTVHVDGNRSLYLSGGCVDSEYYNTRIIVNGETIKIPSIQEPDNELYPAHFNNNSVALGTFADEDVEVVVDMDLSDSSGVIDSRIYEIDIDSLESLCKEMPQGIDVIQGKRSLDITTNDLSDEYKGLLIPVPFSDGWSAILNGRKQEITGVNGLFMYVPINPGNNSIHMSYYPPFMQIGNILAVIAAVVVSMISIRDRRKAPQTNTFDGILGTLYIVAFSGAALVIYIIPVVYAIINMV